MARQGRTKRKGADPNGSSKRAHISKAKQVVTQPALPSENDVSSTFGKPQIPASAKQRFDFLSKRQVISSKFFDDKVIRDDEVKQRVYDYLKNLRWSKFTELRFKSYPILVRAFLATFEFEDKGSFSRLKFELNGQKYDLSIVQVHNALKFEGMTCGPAHSDLNEHEFWKSISTESKFTSRTSRRTALHDVALIYIHEFILEAIFGRVNDKPGVHKCDFQLFYSCVTGHSFCLGYWLGKCLQNCAQKNVGHIRVGGVITALAEAYCDFPKNPIGIEVARGELTCKEDTFRRMNLIYKPVPMEPYQPVQKGMKDETPETPDPTSTADLFEATNPPAATTISPPSASPPITYISPSDPWQAIEHTQRRLEEFFRHTGYTCNIGSFQRINDPGQSAPPPSA
ncbi:unnamed protein product [Linum trigynum]|uniref:Uncharacterized protein n=1 Tax=Linum trigynum TaxID=586398 RepID=A0AAV2G9X3_9ROSI